jgi:hypothetical protein
MGETYSDHMGNTFRKHWDGLLLLYVPLIQTADYTELDAAVFFPLFAGAPHTTQTFLISSPSAEKPAATGPPVRPITDLPVSPRRLCDNYSDRCTKLQQPRSTPCISMTTARYTSGFDTHGDLGNAPLSFLNKGCIPADSPQRLQTGEY